MFLVFRKLRLNITLGRTIRLGAGGGCMVFLKVCSAGDAGKSLFSPHIKRICTQVGSVACLGLEMKKQI